MSTVDALKIGNARKRDIAVSCFLLLEALIEDLSKQEIHPDLMKKLNTDLQLLRCVEMNLNTAFIQLKPTSKLNN